jgi:hypothetical protein
MTLALPSRRQVVNHLVQWSMPLAEIEEHLKRFPWDSDQGVLAICTREHAARALERFLEGAVSAEDLSRWADTINLRDDIGYEPVSGRKVQRMIFELANPEAFDPVTPETARSWLERLPTTGQY